MIIESSKFLPQKIRKIRANPNQSEVTTKLMKTSMKLKPKPNKQKTRGNQ